MWIDDDLIFPIEETFGKLCETGKFTFPSYPFYTEDPSTKKTFEDKFKRHFKYNNIAYNDIDIFKDHFIDIMSVNYPKYKHYFDTLQKAKDLKWWNNKDFVTTFERTLSSTDTKDFTENLEKIEAVIRNLNKTGTVTDAYSRELKESTLENGRTNETNELQKSGENTKTLAKNTAITTHFTRALSSSETHDNTDDKKNITLSSNSSKNDSSTSNTDESTSNNTTKNLDTPQGTINNLIDNVNSYMTSATTDSGRETDMSASSTSGTSSGESKDQTTSESREKKNINSTETGNTNNVESTIGTDITTDKLGEVNKTTIDGTKVNIITLDKTGSATDLKTYNTTDAINKDTTETDTKTGNEKVIGLDDENYRKVEEGNIGVTSAGQLVNDWIKYGYINIDRMILWDCEKLFLQVY